MKISFAESQAWPTFYLENFGGYRHNVQASEVVDEEERRRFVKNVFICQKKRS